MAINDRGDMILWDTGTRYYLRSAAGVLTLLEGGAAGTLIDVTGLNNDGWIAGTMRRSADRITSFVRLPDGSYQFPPGLPWLRAEDSVISRCGTITRFGLLHRR
jgi:hypothetical protein